MRCFVAIPLADEVVKNLKPLASEIAEIQGINGVTFENLHLTLDFLGEIDEIECQRFCRNLQQVAETVQPFSMEISGCGCFRNNGSVQTLWIGVKHNHNIQSLATKVKTAVDSNDIKKYFPHITLGRVKQKQPDTDVFCERYLKDKEKLFGLQQVNCFQLLKSDLSGKIPKYSVIKTFQLKNGGRNG